MQRGTGKRTVRWIKKYSHSAGQRKKERNKEGKIKMWPGRETERDKKQDREQGEGLRSIY